MNHHVVIRDFRVKMREYSRNYIDAMQIVTTYAAYVATMKNEVVTKVPAGYEDYDVAIKEANALAKEWVATPYAMLLSGPNLVAPMLRELKDDLNKAYNSTGTYLIVSATSLAVDCCNRIAARYKLIVDNIDDYHENFSYMKVLIEKTENNLIEINKLHSEEIFNVRKKIDELNEEVNGLTVKEQASLGLLGVGAALAFIGGIVGHFFGGAGR